MKKFTNEYSYLLYESLQDKVSNKITEQYSTLKRAILDLLEKSIKKYEELVNVQNFIHDYIENIESVVLEGFVEDGDVFNVYLKHQVDIDEICNEHKFFDTTPTEKNINSLYGFVITGTKFAVVEVMKILQKEIFTEK